MSKGRIRRGAQKQIYFFEELIALIVVIAALIAGVKFFGLGNLDPSFAILFQGGTDLPLIRAVVLTGVVGFILFALNRKVGKPAGGMPAGVGTGRFLFVLMLGGILVWLVMAWMGRL
jgi:hypothetical protein